MTVVEFTGDIGHGMVPLDAKAQTILENVGSHVTILSVEVDAALGKPVAIEVQTFEPIAAYVAPSTWRAESGHPLRSSGNPPVLVEAAVHSGVETNLGRQ